jgi:hypothetical protein
VPEPLQKDFRRFEGRRSLQEVNAGAAHHLPPCEGS